MFHSPHAPRVLLNGATCTVSISIRNLQTIRHILWFSAWSIHYEYSTRNRDWVSNFAIQLFWDRIFIAHEGQTTLLSSKNCVKALKTLKTMTPTSGLIHHHQTPSANGVVFRLALQLQYIKEKKESQPSNVNTQTSWYSTETPCADPRWLTLNISTCPGKPKYVPSKKGPFMWGDVAPT